jgi:two-component system CheB/CheR fusion protein
MAKSCPAQDDVATQVIDRQLKVLMHLIDDLLDVSRITRGKIQLKCEPIDAAALVERAVAATRPVVEERRHALTVDVAAAPIPLNVDATRVEQVLVNLLSNAAKYTPEGGQIAVRAYVEGHDAVLEVADNGIGIPDEMLPRIFDLFTQVDKSLDRSQGGLGIGLTVVRRLAEMHGGSVSASSDGPGRGSRFVVRLPLASGESMPVRVNTTRHAEPLPLKILVVDDNVDMASTMARLLKRKGHTVAVAHEGHAALETAAAFQPQIVLLDLGLPGIDGYQVAQQLRRETTLARVRLIALSGYGQEQDRKRAQAAGFDRHLVKPVAFEQLLATIGDLQSDGL